MEKGSKALSNKDGLSDISPKKGEQSQAFQSQLEIEQTYEGSGNRKI